MTSPKLHNAKYELLPNIKRPKYSTIQIFLMLISMLFLIIFLIILCYVYHNFTNFKMQIFEKPQRSLNSYYYFKKIQSEHILKTFFNSNYTSVVYLPDNLTVLPPVVDPDPDPDPDYDSDSTKSKSSTKVSVSNPSYKLVCYFIFTHDIDQLFRNFEPDLCTHLNIGFFGIENHRIVVSDQQKQVLNRLQSFKQKNSNLKTLLTIGGAGEPGFPEMVYNHSSRKEFIKSFVKIIHDYQLNGVDLDWEFPSWDNNVQDERQKQHFTQLLEEIRAEINRESDQKRFLLSVAVGSIPSIIDTAYDVQYLNQFVDYVNIMCYDYHMFSKLTPWTGINAPLYSTSKDEGIFEIMNINYSANYWISKGMDRSKIVIGLPTYGHSFKLMNILNNDLQAPALGYGDIGQLGYVTYSEVCKFLNGFGVNLVFDLKSQSPYAYQASNWISYENEHSLTFKTEFIKSNNFGGVMLFNLNSDNFHGRYCDFKNIQSLQNSTNLFHLTHTVKNTLFDDSL